MRLAIFTPFAPVRSGISAYCAELLPLLAATHELDVFVEDEVWTTWFRRTTGRAPNLTRSGPIDVAAALGAAVAEATAVANTDTGGGSLSDERRTRGPIRLWRAHDFVARQVLAPYDVIVYQLGNATCHEYMWPYLLRYPGLVVLHDGQLHHARAYALLRRGRKNDYRAEFRYAHPEAPPEMAEFIVAGLQGPLYYVWPLVAPVIRRARAVAVHNPRLAEDLRERFPEAAITTIRMGVRDAATDGPAAETVDAAAAAKAPALSGAPVAGTDASPAAAAAEKGAGTPAPAGVRFAAFGLVTPEKRIPQVLRALAAVRRVSPDARLTLVGDTADHYDVRAEAEALGLSGCVEITGYVSDEALAAHLTAADVCLCLRWPTARETSASWLRCLAAGKPTVINDLTDLVDIPTLDPRSWTVLHAGSDAAAVRQPPRAADAVAVSIDILDEDHSLELAMRRLATDAALRTSLGRAARRHWEAHHTLSLMAEDYQRAIALAAARPAPDAPDGSTPALPAHLLEDHTAHGRQIATEFCVELEW